jgi:hypothetical protein
MSKKILAVALAAAMILGLASVAFAASFDDTVGHERETAIKQLAGLGLLAGYGDGTFKPDNTITRAEFAKVMVFALGLKDAAEMLTGVPAGFSDVEPNHWATGYISVANSQGIIKGYPDGTFGPQNQVTYAEVITMILRALGYGPVLDKQVWPTAYLAKAAELKLNKGISFLANAPATRGDVAALVANAISKPKLVPIAWGPDGSPTQYGVSGVATDDAVTLLHDMGAESADGYLIDSPELFTNDGAKIQLAGEDAMPVAEGVDCTGLIGRYVRVWLNNDDEVFFVEDITRAADVVAAEQASSTTVDTDDEDDVSVDGATLFRNYKRVGVIGTGSGEVPLTDADEITVVFEKGVAKYVVSLDYEWGVVSTVNTKSSRIAFKKQSDTAAINLDDYDIVWHGAASDFDEIEEDDVVEYIRDSGEEKAVLIVTRESVIGEFSKLTGSAATVDGVAYGFVSGAVSHSLLGQDVTVLLNKDGDIVYMVEATEDTTPDTYAVVLAKSVAGDEFGTPARKLKLFHTDESTATLGVTSTVWNSMTADVVGDVIKYKTNSSGTINSITVVADYDAEYGTLVVDEDLSLVGGYKVTSSTIIIDLSAAHAKLDAGATSISADDVKIASVKALLDAASVDAVVDASAGKAKLVATLDELVVDTAEGLGMYYGSYRTSIDDDVYWVLRILVNGTVTDYVSLDLDEDSSLTANANFGMDQDIPLTSSGSKTLSKTVLKFDANDDNEIDGTPDILAPDLGPTDDTSGTVYELRVTDVDVENGLILVAWFTEDGAEDTSNPVGPVWVHEDTLYYDAAPSSPVSLSLDEIGIGSKISVYDIDTDNAADVVVVHAD